jgi:hypothetical protein
MVVLQMKIRVNVDKCNEFLKNYTEMLVSDSMIKIKRVSL